MNRLVLTILLAVLIQAAPHDTSAQGRVEEFYFIDGDKDYVFFVDAKSIKITGTKRQFWYISHYSKPTKTGVSWGRILSNVDCSSETLSRLYYAFYDDDGNPQPGGAANDTEVVVPGTFADSIYQFVCASSAARLQAGYEKVDHTGDAARRWFMAMREIDTTASDAAAAAAEAATRAVRDR